LPTALRDRKQQFLYLSTKGWKTGTPHRIEIWYVRYEGRFYLVSQFREESHWVQNIRHNPEVTFEVGSNKFHGQGRVIDVNHEPELSAAVSKLMNEKYQWSDGLIVELRAEPGSAGNEDQR